MRIDYDLEADALYATIGNGALARTVQVDDRTAVDLDPDGRLLGVELINVARGTVALGRLVAEFGLSPVHARALGEGPGCG